MSFHSVVTLRASDYAPPDTGVSDLQLVAVERLLSIEGAAESLMDVTFLRGKAPLPGADSPYQGEMSRRDKRGRDAGSAKPRLRGCRRSAGKDPNRKFSLRFGKEETSTEDKKPCLQGFVPSWSFLTRLRRPYLFSRKRKDRGEKRAWTRLVHAASDFRVYLKTGDVTGSEEFSR